MNSGELGRIHLLRSLTRDPSLDEPERVPPGAIFLETLIHDFDVLRFLAGGAEPVEIYALADALKGHPHFGMPEGFIDVVEIMPMPGG